MKIKTSGFGLIDITAGRKALFKKLDTETPQGIPVTIEAVIVSPWGGTSPE